MNKLYRHFDKDGGLLYVGISNSLLRRTHQHSKFSNWFDQITNITIEDIGEDRGQALIIEKETIIKEKPKYNIHHNVSVPLKREEMIDCEQTFIEEQVLRLNPIYDVHSAGKLLEMSTGRCRKEIECGRLGHVRMKKGKVDGYNIKVTGWQILDYLDLLEQEALKETK
jgi:predicted GIY-YIG superfamily endonuclease